MVAIAINETARLLASLELQDKFTGPARTIGSSVDGLERRVGGLQSTFGRVQQGLGQMGRGVGQIGHGIDQIATRAIVAAAGLGTAFVTTAASMEEAFTGVEKTVDETAGFTFEQLKARLRELSVESGTAFEDLSRIGEIGGALGVGIESLDDFIDVVNRLSVSTDLTVDTASTALGQLGTILHLEGDEFRSFADTLVALGNAGASTEPQIVEMAARFAAAGNRAGLTSDEILALSSAVASMGVEVEAGGTALSQTFNKIGLAIGQGSEDVQGFTDVLGISAEEFRTRWETDALGTFQDFLQEISKLDPIAQAVALDMAGITGIRQLNAVGLMADNWEFVGEQLNVASNAQGELGKESDKFFGTAAAGFRRVKESVRLAADTVGTQLLPQIGELSEEFVAWLQDPVQQAAIKEFGENLAGGLRDFVAEIRKADFGPLIGTLQGAASIAKGAFDAFRSLPAPIQQLALAAIVANKVTGGAVGSIAGGLANLLGGALKIAFLDRGTIGNPMIVRDIAGGLGGGPSGPGGPSTGGGPLGQLLRTLGILTVAVPAGIHQAQTGVGSVQGLVSGAIQDVIDTGDQAKIRALRDELQAQLESPVGQLNAFLDEVGVGAGGGQTLITSIDALTAAIVTPPSQQGVNGPPLPASMGGPGASGFGVGALNDLIGKIKSLTTLPDTAVLNKDSFAVVLPDTAMSPVTSELGRVKSEVASQGGRQLAKQEAIAAAVRVNTSVLASKNYAPKFNLTALVTNNVSISDIQRRITSQSVALGLPTRPEPI